MESISEQNKKKSEWKCGNYSKIPRKNGVCLALQMAENELSICLSIIGIEYKNEPVHRSVADALAHFL